MTYTFRCSLCGYEFDKEIPIHTYAEISKKGKMKFRCPKCEQLMNPARVLSATTVIYKGDGFYSTDNRKDKNVNSDRSG